MANYAIRSIDLSSAQERQVIVDPRTGIYNVTVLELPAGADMKLSFGDAPPIPTLQGDEFGNQQGCELENDGLYLTCSAQPGVAARLYIGFEPQLAVTRG